MPRRVLYCAWAPFFSGAERALSLTVQSVDRRRYEPHVVIGTEGETAENLRSAGIPCHVVPFQRMEKDHPVAWLTSLSRLWRLTRQLRPVLIHSNDAPSFQPAGHVAKLLRIPSVTHIRFPDTDEGFTWLLRPRVRRAIFVSEYLRADAIAASPAIFAGRSDVLYDGVRLPPVIDAAGIGELRTELGLRHDATAVAITGQMSEIKGIWEFVDAARILVSSGTTPTFVVLGDDLKGGGKLREAMKGRVAELGPQRRFLFLGFRTDAPRLIPAFDIVAVPSHVEPLGNATLEAMAAGRPVVGSRVGGIPEMVVDGETGLLVPAKNAEALAAALRSLVSSPDRRNAFGRAARIRAADHFGLERHATRLQAIYDDLLAQPARLGDRDRMLGS